MAHTHWQDLLSNDPNFVCWCNEQIGKQPNTLYGDLVVSPRLERRGTKLLVVWPKCSNQLLSNQERPFSHMAPSSSPGKDWLLLNRTVSF